VGNPIHSGANKRLIGGHFCCLQFFPGTKHLDYAIGVEEYTLQKAANLVLNVDGCIGALFLDLLHSSGCFSQKEMDDIISVGYLNGLFVLARSIGLIGHALDQKRLQQPLYRHPWEDVLCECLGRQFFLHDTNMHSTALILCKACACGVSILCRIGQRRIAAFCCG
jgi:hypothetical protein